MYDYKHRKVHNLSFVHVIGGYSWAWDIISCYTRPDIKEQHFLLCFLEVLKDDKLENCDSSRNNKNIKLVNKLRGTLNSISPSLHSTSSKNYYDFMWSWIHHKPTFETLIKLMEKHSKLERENESIGSECEVHENFCTAMRNLANIARKMHFTFQLAPSVEVLNSQYYKLFTHVLGFQDSNSVFLAR